MNEQSEAGITFPPGSWLSSPPPGVSLDTFQLWGHHVAPCVGPCSEGASAWVLQLGCPIRCWPPVLPGWGMLEEAGEKQLDTRKNFQVTLNSRAPWGVRSGRTLPHPCHRSCSLLGLGPSVPGLASRDTPSSELEVQSQQGREQGGSPACLSHEEVYCL